jgi:hypothetical protein
MRGKGLVLGLAGATSLATLLFAQQKPIQGCNAALSCNQPRGFSTLTGNAGGSVLFGVGVRWGPGINFLVVTPSLSSPTPEPTPNMDARTFHLQGVSLLPPKPTSTPVPRPASRG